MLKITYLLFALFLLRVHSFENGDIVAIQSVAFPNVYLRIEAATSCPAYSGSGCGIVNAQYTQGSYEEFLLHKNSDGNWCIVSNAFPNAYLRMDGSSITSSQSSGGGTVNAQYYAEGADCAGYEVYNISSLTNNLVAIQSVYFPGRYLRIDGSTIKSFQASGGGIVNEQYYSQGTTPTGYEVFTFTYLSCGSCENICTDNTYNSKTCNAKTGCNTTPVNCDDGDQCTSDFCDPRVGCIWVWDCGIYCCFPEIGCTNSSICNYMRNEDPNYKGGVGRMNAGVNIVGVIVLGVGVAILVMIVVFMIRKRMIKGAHENTLQKSLTEYFLSTTESVK